MFLVLGMNRITVICGMLNWTRIWVKNAVKPNTTLSMVFSLQSKSLPQICTIRHEERCSLMTSKMVHKWREFVTAPPLIPKKFTSLWKVLDFKNISRSLSFVNKSPETLHMRITNTQYCHLYVLKSRDLLFTSKKRQRMTNRLINIYITCCNLA